MSLPAQIRRDALPRAGSILFRPPSHDLNVARWRINGQRVTILIWTADEWERLPDRPPDAQYYPCGVWCALRVD
jgi:hypothetical protein